MQFQLTPVQIITVCAILNGLVFSYLLFEKKENRPANRFLSLMLVSLCLTFTPYMLDPSVWHKFRWLAWMPFSLSYWIGPAFYFYVRTLTDPLGGFKRHEWWHFAPIVLNYIHSFYHATAGNTNPYPKFHHLAEYLEGAAIVSILIYMYISYQLIIKYQKALLDRVSNLDLIDLNWIKRFIWVIVLSFIAILIFLSITSGLSGKESLDQWDQFREGVLFLYALILYWLSISGFKQAQTFQLQAFTVNVRSELQTSPLVKRLQQAMIEKKLYRNPDLNLSDLSRDLGMSERAISEALNQELRKNYYQFVNEYRVQEVKKQLVDPERAHLKIMSLAFDAGFNSKASFNRVFKIYTGVTPQQYQSQNSTN